MNCCESCSMPMNQKEDFGGGDENCKYCKYCAPEGVLKSREEVRAGWIQACMNMENISEEEATKKVNSIMPNMPAWKEGE